MNDNLFLFINGLAGKNSYFDFLMVFGAQYLVYLIVILSLILAFKGGIREKKAFFITVLAFLLGVLISDLIKHFLKIPRPGLILNIHTLISTPNESSFPSTHTTMAAVFAFAYTYYRSKFAKLFIILLLWVGFSRIFVGVHYPLDVFGGIITGLLAVHIIWTLKNSVSRFT